MTEQSTKSSLNILIALIVTTIILFTSTYFIVAPAMGATGETTNIEQTNVVVEKPQSRYTYHTVMIDYRKLDEWLSGFNKHNFIVLGYEAVGYSFVLITIRQDHMY